MMSQKGEAQFCNGTEKSRELKNLGFYDPYHFCRDLEEDKAFDPGDQPVLNIFLRKIAGWKAQSKGFSTGSFRKGNIPNLLKSNAFTKLVETDAPERVVMEGY